MTQFWAKFHNPNMLANLISGFRVFCNFPYLVPCLPLLGGAWWCKVTEKTAIYWWNVGKSHSPKSEFVVETI